MKIVFLKSRLSFNGGLEKYTLKLATYFAEKGHDVTILTTGSPPEVKHVQIISLGKSSKWSFYHFFHFNSLCNKWLKKHPVDCIFGMERNSHQTHYRAGSGVHASFLKRRFEVESFLKKLSLLFNPLHIYLLYLEKKAFEDPLLRCLIVNSKMVKDEILSYYETQPSKIFVIHNGVAWKSYEPFFNQFSPIRKPIHFLFVGNGYKRKGLNFLLSALSSLPHEDFHLTIVGKDKNLPEYQKLIDELDLTRKVSLKGPIENLIPYYQAADILILPTLYDPFANVTLEALAMGLFVITSKANGGAEVLTEKNGYVIENLNDIESLKSAILIGLKKPKTFDSAREIRDSIKHLEFSNQLDKIVSKTIET